VTRKLLPLVAVLALALPAPAAAARFAVGVEPGASTSAVAREVRAATGGTVKPLAPFGLVLESRSAARVAAIPGVRYVERLGASQRRIAFIPTDPLFAKQWYLQQIRAFDAWPVFPGPFNPRVRVAVIDSGIDGTHPDLIPRTETGKSFVGGSWKKDMHGHGTFVAGIIAAETGNAEGISGIGLGTDLLIAKVVRDDGTISLEAEAEAIRWAVKQGAAVINLSFGGIRDPRHPKRDTYSRLEADAIEWAVRKGVVVVAAVGNGDQAPSMPWRYASYPAALPHVIGVSALARDGSVPTFSNRDDRFNDIAAPGVEIFSAIPRGMTSQRSTCLLQGYSECGPAEFRKAEGTSFAAPQVSAAAAQLLSVSQQLGVNPALRPEQVASLLTRSAQDITPLSGCKRCPYDRDRLSGWGRLDVTAALDALRTGQYGGVDAYEPNDDGGRRAWPLGTGRDHVLATLDYWDDRVDVYRVRLRRGEGLRASVRGPAGTDMNLMLFKPGLRRIGGPASRRLMAARSTSPGAVESMSYRAPVAGWYFVQVAVREGGSGEYSLRLLRS
jgi:subtilisin family serine protease